MIIYKEGGPGSLVKAMFCTKSSVFFKSRGGGYCQWYEAGLEEFAFSDI
jgi:hypothetical protein